MQSYYRACSFVVITWRSWEEKLYTRIYVTLEPDHQKLNFWGSGSETSYVYLQYCYVMTWTVFMNSFIKLCTACLVTCMVAFPSSTCLAFCPNSSVLTVSGTLDSSGLMFTNIHAWGWTKTVYLCDYTGFMSLWLFKSNSSLVHAVTVTWPVCVYQQKLVT